MIPCCKKHDRSRPPINLHSTLNPPDITLLFLLGLPIYRSTYNIINRVHAPRNCQEEVYPLITWLWHVTVITKNRCPTLTSFVDDRAEFKQKPFGKCFNILHPVAAQIKLEGFEHIPSLVPTHIPTLTEHQERCLVVARIPDC